MNYEERTMKSNKIYEGHILSLRVDTVELPDQKYSKREIVEHVGAVGVVAITEDGQVVLVRQYRKAVEKSLLEIPAGLVNASEEPGQAAKRELQEETGYTCGRLDFMTEFYPSPGFSTEKIHLFLARDLVQGEVNRDDDEFLELESMPFEEALRKVYLGEFSDAKTMLALLLAKDFMEEVE